jgi:hypothetical protein
MMTERMDENAEGLGYGAIVRATRTILPAPDLAPSADQEIMSLKLLRPRSRLEQFIWVEGCLPFACRLPRCLPFAPYLNSFEAHQLRSEP